jgi:deazaflavin-dependent oxidoreductase (nitroreductase family)
MNVAVIHHQGWRSGRSYATPTSARPTRDGFIVPMTFGEQADWVRNVRAAGGCTIEWKGKSYPVGEPEIMDRAAARSAFSPVERLLLPLMGINLFMHLRHTPESTSTAH